MLCELGQCVGHITYQVYAVETKILAGGTEDRLKAFMHFILKLHVLRKKE